MTFKALILVHKVIQEGHKIAIKEGQDQTGWLDTCSRTMGSEGNRGYSSLIRSYVSFILAKLKFHKNHSEFNGLFEYEEYISLKGIDNPDEGFITTLPQILRICKLILTYSPVTKLSKTS